MKAKARKSMTGAAAVITALAVLAGCGAPKTDSGQTNTYVAPEETNGVVNGTNLEGLPIAAEPITLTVGVSASSSSFQGAWELMSQDELAVMDGGKCILQLRGVRPFLSEKFDITKHPNYKYLSDYDKKNAFDIERFLSARLKLRPDEQFAAYSIDLSGDEAAEETGG